MNWIERHPAVAGSIFGLMCLGTGAALALLIPSRPSEHERILEKLNAIEKRLDALETSQKRPVAR